MLLHHVSYEPIESFRPRVPMQRLENIEDNKTPRICFSESIIGCLRSMPGGGESLKAYLHLCEKRDALPILYVYTIGTELQPVELVNPATLVKKYMVLDAEINSEWWATNEIKHLSETRIIIEDAEINYRLDLAGNPGEYISFAKYRIAEDNERSIILDYIRDINGSGEKYGITARDILSVYYNNKIKSF